MQYILKNNSKSGITLVSLVVTIIVLIILAGVSINMVLGENGIIKMAMQTKQTTEKAVAEEDVRMKMLQWEQEEAINGITLKQFLKENYNSMSDNADGTYTVVSEGIEITVGEDGNITEKIEETDIYVTLYDDGTLVFSNEDKVIEGKTVVKSYGNIRGNHYYTTHTPWNSDVESITTVNIVNKIVPTSTSRWFANCKNVTTIYNMDNIITNKVTSMYEMFSGCASLEKIDLKEFYTKNVTNMGSMFYGCIKITSLDLNNFNTENVTNMGRMFYDCNSLTELNLKGFNTKNVKLMLNMFTSCTSLTSLDLSSFQTGNVTNMSFMFTNCRNLVDLNVSNFNTSQVTNMTQMFATMHSIQTLDLTSFDTSNVEQMVSMFTWDSKLKTITATEGKWVTSTNNSGMFTGCGTSEITLVPPKV